MTEARKLHDTVIKNGYCIGCGACASIPGSPFNIEMDKYGNIVAQAKEEDLYANSSPVLEVCPFSELAKNETELADVYFPDVTNKHSQIGKFLKCYAGHVKGGDYRLKGSSGGIGKWVGYKLLEQGEVDYLIQLKPNTTKDAGERLFEYHIFDKASDVLQGSKSAYYPTTLVKVLDVIKKQEGRYAITGVPCFIKTLRLLSEKDSILKERIKFTIGIICGGMKSANQAKMIGWQLGVHPDNLVGIDFRRKHPNRPASEKVYQVWSNKDNIERYKDSNEIYGTDYGAGFFKPLACDYCDDVVAETADISVGDAWIKKYSQDPKGNSLILVRNSKLLNILEKESQLGKLEIDEITDEDAAMAQSGAFRHRREALSRRIAKKEAKGEWYPTKRVKANEFQLTPKREQIYDLREEISIKSHDSFYEALKRNDLNFFFKDMNTIVKKYVALNDITLFRKFLRFMKRKLIYDILKKY